MYIGADYYPEHWPESRWDLDMKLMKEAGFNVVRLAEFDWVNIEPSEGEYQFEFWDRVLAKLAEYDISVIMSTPTASMPAWMKEKYPEALAIQDNGQRKPWGNRKNNCFSNKDFQRLSRGVTKAMAEHFSETPNIIGWQTDNEFGHPLCYCDSCRTAFQEWCKAKYNDLDALNAAWGTHFWGHRYQEWQEIPVPLSWGQNPSLQLDWQRFYSSQNVSFQKDQIDILRKHCPNHFVMHNLMGFFPELNYYDLSADLDFCGWDSYPIWRDLKTRYDASSGADLMRGMKKKNFWIIEQTSGPCGGEQFGRNSRPGEIRSVAFQHLAHGADGMLWFRWRTCTAGTEEYWHGLLGHDGRPLRRYEEAKQTACEFRKIESLLKDTMVKPEVGIVYDYDSLWAGRIQPGFDNFDMQNAIKRYYNALFRAGVNVDFVKADDDLTEYKIVLAPGMYVMPDAVADNFISYVEQGGVFLTDCRTGVKDECNRCHERTLPGKLSEMLGIEIQEYGTLGETMQYEISGTGSLPGKYTAIDYVDWTTSKGADCVAVFNQWHLKDQPAASKNTYGKGFGFYVSTVVKEEEFYDKLIDLLLKTGKVKAVVSPPEGVETVIREKKGRKLLFLLNHSDEEKTINVPENKEELLNEAKTGKELKLERYGVAVIRI